jgi:ferric-dicitrate binding protein FerR (iron transport regulator)
MTDPSLPDAVSAAAARVAEIERRIEDWQARLPAHTMSPRMMAELDALEEALAAARRAYAEALHRLAASETTPTDSPA